jgi:UDP-2,3-diacylglucosamine pyrophosphatase LpxH
MTESNFPQEKIVVNHGQVAGSIFIGPDLHVDELRWSETIRLWRKIRRERRRGLEVLILIGDVVGQTTLRRYQHRLLNRISAIAEKGDCTVVWIRGNHDRPLTDWIRASFSPKIVLCDEFLWTDADGEPCLAVHGDQWDRYEEALLRRPVRYWLHTQLYAFFRCQPFGLLFLCYTLRWYKERSTDWKLVCKTVRDGVIGRARELNVKKVFFGHTHRRESHKLPDGLRVFNLGTAAELEEGGWCRLGPDGSIQSGCL